MTFQDSTEHYREQVSLIASKPNVVWREIVVFAFPERFAHVKKLLDANPEGYNVVYYDVPPDSCAPRITFSVIDREEVIIAGYQIYLAVRHPDIVEYFERYYENLWAHGTALKIGNRVNHSELEKLVAHYL